MDDLERLKRENVELKRDLAEQRVRLSEILDSGRVPPVTRGARVGEAAPAPSEGAEARADSGRRPSLTPASVAPSGSTLGGEAAGAIEEESITEPGKAPGEEEPEGERTLWVARQYGDQGRNREAIDAYGRFIRDFPFSPLLPEAFVERARARLKTGDRQGALEDYRTVAEAFPESRLAAEARREAARLGNP
jgi:tetratricopeptide (TPR) repeat protein